MTSYHNFENTKPMSHGVSWSVKPKTRQWGKSGRCCTYYSNAASAVCATAVAEVTVSHQVFHRGTEEGPNRRLLSQKSISN